MRTALQLATATLLLAATVETRAQITNPDALVGKPPRNPAVHGPEKKVYDLQWLWAYTGNKPGLLADPRFPALLAKSLRAPQAFWSAPGSPLADAAHAFLGGPGSVADTGNRYLTVTGCVVDPAPDADTIPCAQRGLLWIDLGKPEPLITFAALRWNERTRGLGQTGTPYTLWLFPNQELDPAQLPEALQHALAVFAGCPAPTVTSAVLVLPTGLPHVVGTAETGVLNHTCSAPTR